jgi:hypothetical protein
MRLFYEREVKKNTPPHLALYIFFDGQPRLGTSPSVNQPSFFFIVALARLPI